MSKINTAEMNDATGICSYCHDHAGFEYDDERDEWYSECCGAEPCGEVMEG